MQEIKNKTKQQQKLSRRGETGQLARLGRARQGKARQGKARQGKARQEQETYDDELAQDCKHKKIIKGANEEGNEGRQVVQIKQ